MDATALARCTLTVGHTWDGVALPVAAHTRWLLVVRARELVIGVDAPFHDDPAPDVRPGPTPGLWEHEVVELFLAGANRVMDETAVEYTEIELGPHGHHLVLRLRGVRRTVAEQLPLRYRRRRRGERWQGLARIDRGLLPPLPWRANAYAIHGGPAGRRYAAATPLPGPHPDFHQPHRFAALEWTRHVTLAPRTRQPPGGRRE